MVSKKKDSEKKISDKKEEKKIEGADLVKPELVPQKEVAKERTKEQGQLALKRKVRIFYDLQRLRMQTAGRTLNRAPETEIALHPADVLVLESRALDLHRAERGALRDVEEHLNTMSFYVNVLSDKKIYRGIGPTMAGVILSEFKIDIAEVPSQFHSYAGLVPKPAKRCKTCHYVVELVEGTGADEDEINDSLSEEELLEIASRTRYKHKTARRKTFHKSKDEGEDSASTKTNKCAKIELSTEDVYDSGIAMRPVAGEKLPYNAFLRSKLCGVLGPVMLQLNSPWRKYYDDYKNRKLQAGWGMSDAHRHAASIRYMIKMLLLNIWEKWRTHEGLSIRMPYQEEYLGHKHNGVGGFPTVEPYQGSSSEAHP